MSKSPCCQRKNINTNIWDKTLQPYKYYLNYWYKTAESFATHDSTHINSPMLKTAAHEYKSSYFNVKLYISWLIIIFFLLENCCVTVWRWYSEYVLTVCHKNNYFQISKLHLGQHPHQILTFTTTANINTLECILLMLLHPHNGNINACQNAERISKREAKPLETKSPTHLNYTSNIPRLVFFLYMK
jgi:hypothetical protein